LGLLAGASFYLLSTILFFLFFFKVKSKKLFPLLHAPSARRQAFWPPIENPLKRMNHGKKELKGKIGGGDAQPKTGVAEVKIASRKVKTKTTKTK